jgi:hypothetical protein
MALGYFGRSHRSAQRRREVSISTLSTACVAGPDAVGPSELGPGWSEGQELHQKPALCEPSSIKSGADESRDSLRQRPRRREPGTDRQDLTPLRQRTGNPMAPAMTALVGVFLRRCAFRGDPPSTQQPPKPVIEVSSDKPRGRTRRALWRERARAMVVSSSPDQRLSPPTPREAIMGSCLRSISPNRPSPGEGDNAST